MKWWTTWTHVCSISPSTIANSLPISPLAYLFSSPSQFFGMYNLWPYGCGEPTILWPFGFRIRSLCPSGHSDICIFVAISCGELDSTSFHNFYLFFIFFHANLAGKAARPTNKQLWAPLRATVTTQISRPRTQKPSTQKSRNFLLGLDEWWLITKARRNIAGIEDIGTGSPPDPCTILCVCMFYNITVILLYKTFILLMQHCEH